MMKTLILSLRILRKRGKSTALLIVEMVLALMILVGISSKIIYIEESRNIVNTFKNTDIYYFTKAMYYSPDFKLENVLEQEILNNIEIGRVELIGLETSDSRLLNCIGYSDLILEHINWKLNDGEYFADDSGQYVQAIAVGEEYNVGDIIYLVNDEKIKIIGTMDPGSYLITCHGSGSPGYASLEGFIEKIEQPVLIVPWESSKFHTIDLDNMVEGLEIGSEFIKIKETYPKEKVLKELQNYGCISYIEDMEINYSMDNQQFFITNGVILIVMTILVTIGIAGINGIQLEKNSKDYSVYYICGMSPAKNMCMESINTLLLGILTYLCFRFIYNMFGNEIFGEQVRLKWYISLIVTGYILIVYFVSSISFIFKAKKYDIVELYKRG